MIVAAIQDEPSEIIANNTIAKTIRANVMKFGTFNERRSMRGSGGIAEAGDIEFGSEFVIP